MNIAAQYISRQSARLIPRPIIVLLLLCLAVFIGFAMSLSGPFQVEYISVSGDMSPKQREEVLADLSQYSSFGVNIKDIKQHLEKKLWVSKISVKRSWPDELRVIVVPQYPIALWNENAFINDRGMVFSSDHKNVERLAQLYGPEGSEKRVMSQYQKINNVLLKTGQSIDVIRLDVKGSWTIRSDAGIEILLGKDELMARMQKLMLVVDHIESLGQLDKVSKIDTRYPNGVAISWKENMEGLSLAKTTTFQREQKL